MTPRLSEKALAENLGKGNFIFVCSTADLFGSWVPDSWIERTLEHCRMFGNRYLFQTKNPARMRDFLHLFPPDRFLGTTIETNREIEAVSKAPPMIERASHLAFLPGRKMVSIEPVMDFDLPIMLQWMREISPEFVSIGADSKNSHLPEPSGDKLKALIEGLRTFTEVRLKPNLQRLLR